MFSEISFFLVLLNMFADKIPPTGINFIWFHLQGLILLDFGELHKLSEGDAVMSCVRTGPNDDFVDLMRASLGPY